MARQTPLVEAHRAAGGRMVDFAGWELPVQYESVVAEHEAVRAAAGLFDVSHMGEIEFSGPGALDAVNGLISNDLDRCADGQALYAGLLNDEGGFVDDVVVYRFSPQRILLCVNASNREKDFAWMCERFPDIRPRQRSDDFAQLALQGPASAAILQRLTSSSLSALGNYRFTEGEVAKVPCLISRTGYTGEDGFELYCSPGAALSLWNALLEEGRAEGLKPAGLGARDSLRTEVKYPLYGQDIDAVHTPLEAGLSWAVKLDKERFVGKAALQAQKERGPQRKWVGFELTESGVPRHGYPVLAPSGSEGSGGSGAQRVGEVTSGTFGPAVQRPIGMAYVPVALAREGTPLQIEIRGRAVAAQVVKTPFWRRKA